MDSTKVSSERLQKVLPDALAALHQVIEKHQVPIATLSDRVRLVVKSAFIGRRIVIFSGGAAKGTEAVLEEIGEIAKGGGYGSIVGRNAFQRSNADAVKLLHDIMDLYAAQA